MCQLLGMGPTNKQEMMSHDRKASTMLSLTDWCLEPSPPQFCSFIFNKKYSYIRYGLIFFYSKVQHIPSASDYIKTYNVHTVDISTLPFTVSGLNRHYFSGFSSLQQIIKLKSQQERKWQMFAYDDKGYGFCEYIFHLRKKKKIQTPPLPNQTLKPDGNIQWIVSKCGMSVFCLLPLNTNIGIWLIEDFYPDYSGTAQDCITDSKEFLLKMLLC